MRSFINSYRCSSLVDSSAALCRQAVVDGGDADHTTTYVPAVRAMGSELSAPVPSTVIGPFDDAGPGEAPVAADPEPVGATVAGWLLEAAGPAQAATISASMSARARVERRMERKTGIRIGPPIMPPGVGRGRNHASAGTTKHSEGPWH